MSLPADNLRRWCLDYDGSWMDRKATPHDGLHCDDLYDAIHELDRLTAALTAERAEVVRLREERDKYWMLRRKT